MPEPALRAILIVGVAAIAIVAGLLETRRRGTAQAPVRVDGLGFDSAIVVFTSTDCSRCRRTMRQLSALGATVREVAHELEPGLFESVGVDGVPLVVIMTPDGNRSSQFGGAVSDFRLNRALARAGW